MKPKIAGITRVLAPLFVVACFTSCGDHQIVSSEDVELRKNKRGALILYRISREKPFDGMVTDKYPDGEPRFEVRYTNGLRDGNFTFWRENEIPLLRGGYRKGKRHGLLAAYGKAGEKVYEKQYADDKLNGPCRFYYPYSDDDVENYFLRMDEEGLELGELKANSKLRYFCEFLDDAPKGRYEAFYHKSEEVNSTKELLREHGHFDANGSLVREQVFYFPEVDKLSIKLPTGKMLDDGFDASEKGLSRAIESAYIALEELPAYRNREDKPALVFALDERGNEIVPVWTTDIYKIVIRDLNGTVLPKRYGTTFDEYDRAKQRAEDLQEEHGLAPLQETRDKIDLDTDESSSDENDKEAFKPAIEVLGLDKHGKVIEILWTTDSDSYVIPLHERIVRKRHRLLRAWMDGKSWGTRWYLPDGSNLSILDEQRREIIQAGKKQTTKISQSDANESHLPEGE